MEIKTLTKIEQETSSIYSIMGPGKYIPVGCRRMRLNADGICCVHERTHAGWESRTIEPNDEKSACVEIVGRSRAYYGTITILDGKKLEISIVSHNLDCSWSVVNDVGEWVVVDKTVIPLIERCRLLLDVVVYLRTHNP